MKLVKASLSWPSQQTPTEVCIHTLAVGAHEEMTKVQLELNLHIVELWLKVHPSTPLEVREQRTRTIKVGLNEIGSAVRDCARMLEESFEVLTNLKEEPNIQHLET